MKFPPREIFGKYYVRKEKNSSVTPVNEIVSVPFVNSMLDNTPSSDHKCQYGHYAKSILILGAGPTGLALACRCRQLGFEPRIIDRKPGPATTSNAIGLQYRVSGSHSSIRKQAGIPFRGITYPMHFPPAFD